MDHLLHATSVVDANMAARRSIRAFLPDAVPMETVNEILRVARRAPSGTNTQPWKVHVLTGAARTSLSARLCEVFDDPELMKQEPRSSIDWPQPYLGRRRKVGWDLYGLLQIEKGDKARMHRQHRRNLEFFGAPVGLIFTLEKFMSASSYLDVGMLMQNIMLAARAREIDTCPQGVFVHFRNTIAAQLGLAENEKVVCGMALGYRDPGAPENTLETEREPLEQFVRYHE